MATILLIDDHHSLRFLFKSTLEGAGYHVLTADDGKPGLRLLEYVKVDVIVMDVCMPEMDGLELMPRIRRMQLGACRSPSSATGSAIQKVSSEHGGKSTGTRIFVKSGSAMRVPVGATPFCCRQDQCH